MQLRPVRLEICATTEHAKAMSALRNVHALWCLKSPIPLIQNVQNTFVMLLLAGYQTIKMEHTAEITIQQFAEILILVFRVFATPISRTRALFAMEKLPVSMQHIVMDLVCAQIKQRKPMERVVELRVESVILVISVVRGYACTTTIPTVQNVTDKLSVTRMISVMEREIA